MTEPQREMEGDEHGELWQTVEQLAHNGVDLERRVQALERRGLSVWLRRLLQLGKERT